MLQHRNAELWLATEDDIFAQIAKMDSGFITGPVAAVLADVGITDYRTVLTSHHRVLYRQVDGTTFVYAAVGQTQDFQALLLKRLFRR